jgi:uncharacterized repeat protein (TIGR04052 family)
VFFTIIIKKLENIMSLCLKQLPVSFALASSVMLAACSEDDVPAAMTTQEVTINFAAQVNGQDFVCDTANTGVGTGGHEFKVTDFRLFVHDAYIRDAVTGEDHAIELTQDGVWQKDNLALLDFEDATANCLGTAETNKVLAGTVPATVDMEDAEVCFTVGVPEDKNHLDVGAVESPLNDASMYWAWKVGYKYIRIDGVGDPAGTPNPFVLHLGAQGCPGESTTAAPTASCTVPNTFEVCIANFDVENDVIAVDPANVFEGNDVSTNHVVTTGAEPVATKPGCMSFIGDDDCEEIMPRLGLDYSYGRSATGVASTYTAGQRLFSKQ